MTSAACRFIKAAIFLLILCILSAGCTSKTDVQPAPSTPVPTKYAAKVISSIPTPQVTVSDDGSKTCRQLSGTIAIPGQVCTGTWLMASDSFSCCSKTPVAGKITKPRLAVEPLDLQITHNDTFADMRTG